MTAAEAPPQGDPATPGTATLPPTTPPATEVPSGFRVDSLRRALQRPIAACLVLFAAYCGLSTLNDPRAFLGTDTGGKVATLRAMDARGDLDPDLGYWAGDVDPTGVAHPIALTYHLQPDGGRERWVNVTTLPMLYAAVPLYELGGLRAILVLPMLGGVLTALAARALARRLGSTTGDAAFWLVGLATPVAVYALDFWEHTLGLAAMLWAVVLLLDVAEDRAGWRAAAGGGVLFGAAATMRTEAVVYAAVTALVVGAAVVSARRRDLLRCAAAGAVGFVVPLGVNQVLEHAVLGQGLRAARASGAAADAGSHVTARIEDALRTTVGLNNFSPPLADWVIGGLIVVLIAVGVRALLAQHRRVAVLGVAFGAAALLLTVRLRSGLGFVPGMLVTSPLAVAGALTCGSDRRFVRPALIALGALPLVWWFQYGGGANPQWGGRYVLCSGALLAVVGVVALARRGPRALVLPALLAALVTGAGVAWLSERSHAVAHSMEQITDRPGPIVTTGLPHLLREGGAFFTPGSRWLTAEVGSEVPAALAVLERRQARGFTLVARFRRQAPAWLGDYRRVDRHHIGFVGDVELTVARYRR